MTTNNNIDDRPCCNCKKSECLKLYCPCFAAEFYCQGRCSCKDCYNSLDYEDSVDMAREQIEARNPFAFSPKIHFLEDGDKLKPFPGKHKKGCNCRKSMCQKNYCECYQGKVGCSDACRCEGCLNVYGKKGDLNAVNESSNMMAIHEKSNYPGLGLSDDHHKWPPSQPFEYPGQGGDTSITHFLTEAYIPQPCEDLDMMLGTGTGNFDMFPSLEFMNPQDTSTSRAMNDTQVEWPNLNYPNVQLIESWDGNTSNMPIDSCIMDLLDDDHE